MNEYLQFLISFDSLFLSCPFRSVIIFFLHVTITLNLNEKSNHVRQIRIFTRYYQIYNYNYAQSYKVSVCSSVGSWNCRCCLFVVCCTAASSPSISSPFIGCLLYHPNLRLSSVCYYLTQQAASSLSPQKDDRRLLYILFFLLGAQGSSAGCRIPHPLLLLVIPVLLLLLW